MTVTLLFMVILDLVDFLTFEELRKTLIKVYSSPLTIVLLLATSAVLVFVGLIIVLTSDDVFKVALGICTLFFALILLVVSTTTSLDVTFDEVKEIFEEVFSVFKLDQSG